MTDKKLEQQMQQKSSVDSIENNRLYSPMQKLNIELENTKTAFIAQVRRRKELTDMISQRLGIERALEYEKFFSKYYPTLTSEEKFVFDQIRANTSGAIYKSNHRMHKILLNKPELSQEIPSLNPLRKHLSFWLNKYEQVFLDREDMCVLYVGVEDGVPFPKEVDALVVNWLKEHAPYTRDH